MRVRTWVKKVVNALLAPLGVTVRRIEGPTVELERYEKLLEETLACYQDCRFPGMPPAQNRVKLLAQVSGPLGKHVGVLHYLHRSLPLAGAICEFGVARGNTSALIANEIGPSGKELWLFDSFQGLSAPTEKDVLLDDMFNLGSMEAYQGAIRFPLAEVKSRLAQVSFPASRTRIIEGYIEETIHQADLPERVCFAYVDFDLYEPIRVALDFLHERLPVGGFIVVDDYGFFSSGAQTAVDEFVAAHAARFHLTLPPAYAGHFAVLEKIA